MAKYLSFFNADGPGFVVWAGGMSHADMARALGASSVRSAGFIHLAPSGDLHCDGRSESLDIAALPADSLLANNLLKSV